MIFENELNITSQVDLAKAEEKEYKNAHSQRT